MKKLKTILFIVFIFAMRLPALLAQDILILRNGDVINVKVLEVLDAELKYKKQQNLDGPVYSAKKTDIYMVKYGNGEKEMFQTPTTADNNTSTPPANTTTTTTQTPSSLPKPEPPPLVKKEEVIVKNTYEEAAPIAELKNTALHLNVLGPLTFGPVLNLEFKITPKTYLMYHIRYGYLGLFTHKAYKIEGMDKKILKLSPLNIGVGTGFKHFFAAGQKGAFYTGLEVEFSCGGSHFDQLDDIRSWRQKDAALNFSGNFGYRWINASDWILNIGILPFVSKKIKNEWWDADKSSVVYRGDKRWMYGSVVELSVGKQF